MAVQPDTIIRKLAKALLSLFDFDLADAVRVLKNLARRYLASRPEGMYEVLEHDARLELCDAKGSKAVYSKRQRVRFLQDNIIAYQDQAWGDGEIFADYKCSPGVPVDRYREGHRWRVLISLRETKNRNDVEEFHIKRTIRDGFTGAVEDFQTEIAHTTRRLSLSVVFPKNRFPKEASLVEQNATRTTELGPSHRATLPDGRQQVVWRTDKPVLFEAYILRWRW